MRRSILCIATTCVGLTMGQTQVDLSTQSKNIDFSAAASTRPTKTGTVLPPLCKTGDIFFKLDAAAGSNLFGCTSTNSWTQLSGGGGSSSSSSFQSLVTDAVVANTATVITIAAGIFRNNNVITKLSTAASVQATAGSLGAGSQVWIEFDPVSQTRFVISNANVTQSRLSITNLVLGAANAGGFTSGRIPIATCAGGAVVDTWSSCTDARTPFAAQTLSAGPGITIGAANSSGSQQISAASSNPLVYKTLVNGTTSCPPTEATLASYQFPSSANVAAGDSIEITVWFQKTGASTPAIGVRLDGTYANNPATLGNLLMLAPVYSIRARAQVLSATSIVYQVEARSDTASVLVGSPLLTGATITSTPLIEFRASGCAGADTVRVLSAIIILSKGASL